MMNFTFQFYFRNGTDTLRKVWDQTGEVTVSFSVIADTQCEAFALIWDRVAFAFDDVDYMRVTRSIPVSTATIPAFMALEGSK
jgi:hypothetical protein